MVRDQPSAAGQAESDIGNFARTGQFEQTAISLGGLADLKTEIVLNAMRQERPDAIIMIARAAGLTWPTAKAILLLCARNCPHVALDLERSLAAFTRLRRETAKQVIQFYRARG
jgi:Uncharacterised protein conserved in bacteria (DUF2336)